MDLLQIGLFFVLMLATLGRHITGKLAANNLPKHASPNRFFKIFFIKIYFKNLGNFYMQNG